MEIIGIILIVLGIIMAIFTNIWFLVAAFRVSIWWGLACLLLPIVSFFFLIVHWDVAKRPFGYMLLSIVILIIGAFLLPGHTLQQH
jgi:FtsH-binding integral membrane protein